MELLDVAVLCATAFAASVLSAILGMAGGILLLTVMLIYLEPLVAVPLHGVVQLVANSSRAVIQRKHVRWALVWRYALALIPMSWLGLHAAVALPAQHTRSLIGLFVIVATWRPDWLMLGMRPDRSRPERRFIVLGGVAGFLQMAIGATGPLIAPFFLNLGLDRRGVVGTKAAVQTTGHLTKITIFAIGGFLYLDYALLLLGLSGMVVVGTWLGSQFLERVNERVFRALFRGVLTLIALRLLLLS